VTLSGLGRSGTARTRFLRGRFRHWHLA
jgi:hypothetical protein